MRKWLPVVAGKERVTGPRGMKPVPMAGFERSHLNWRMVVKFPAASATWSSAFELNESPVGWILRLRAVSGASSWMSMVTAASLPGFAGNRTWVFRSPSAIFSPSAMAGVKVMRGLRVARDCASFSGAGNASTAMSWNGSMGVASFCVNFAGPVTRVSEEIT
jgi:hypothetical protein